MGVMTKKETNNKGEGFRSDLMRKIETIKGMLPEGRNNVRVVL